MRKLCEGTPPGRKESTQDAPELEAAAKALREEFLRKFGNERQATASRAHQQIQKSLPRVVVSPIPLEDPHAIRGIEDTRWFVRLVPVKPIVTDGTEPGQNPRHTFSQHLEEWCGSFPGLPKKFIEDLCRLRRAFEWVQREAEKTWPELGEEYQEWVTIACDGQAIGRDWCAPRWLGSAISARQLAGPPWERLDLVSTAEVLKIVGAEVQGRLNEAQRMALNQARVLIAEEKEAARHAANNMPPAGEQPERPEEFSQKKHDFSNHFDGANLTDLQRNVMSLKFEYELSVNAIAARLDRHRSTVQETLNAAIRKINASGAKEWRDKRRAERNPGTLE